MIAPRYFLYMYAFAEGCLILLSLFFGFVWLVNTQVAFFCSLCITMATFFSYRRMVETRVEAGAYVLEEEDEDEEKDPDDPAGLWREEPPLPPVDFRTMAKEEKERQKNQKQGFFGKLHLSQSLPSLVFPYRLVAYLLLYVGFLALQRQEIFEVVPFVIGLGVVPLTSLFTPLFQRQ
ncbi:MAG: hypothetical protein IBX45_01350 [Campylobacterales bacterium]|nr:hypothetical protein [Campylobacterales bacterium]